FAGSGWPASQPGQWRQPRPESVSRTAAPVATIAQSANSSRAAKRRNQAGVTANDRSRPAGVEVSTCTRISVTMSEFSQRLIERSGHLGGVFAAVYAPYRPTPPAGVLAVLAHIACPKRPRLVVDLGCGTGLATRAWAGRADEVVGVEPNPRM